MFFDAVEVSTVHARYVVLMVVVSARGGGEVREDTRGRGAAREEGHSRKRRHLREEEWEGEVGRK